MLKLRSPTAATEPALSASTTVLAVSWLNGRFAAVAVRQGQVTGRWIGPALAEKPEELTRLLREAIQQTGYDGATVQMVLAHPRLSQLWLEVPEIQNAGIRRFLDRQVQQGKSFDGPAVFSSQPTMPSKLSKGLLLHVLPAALVTQLSELADAAGLVLTSAIPVAVVVQRQLQRLPLAQDEVAVLAVEVGGQTVLAAGRQDGEICLARTLTQGWSRNPERFAAEVNRTILFLGQQFPQNAGGVWLLGPVAPEILAKMQADFSLPLRQSPAETAEDWWATEALQVPADHPANFIGRERRAEPERRRLLAVTLTVVAAMLLLSALITVHFRHLRLAGERQRDQLKQDIGLLSQRFQRLATAQAELTNHQSFVREATDGRPPPVPAWFLGHLSETIGPDLVLTNLQIRAGGDRWRVVLTGHLPAPVPEANSNRLAGALGNFTNQLARGPFHVRFATNGPAGAGRKDGLTTFDRWVSRFNGGTARPTTVPTLFRIEGSFQ